VGQVVIEGEGSRGRRQGSEQKRVEGDPVLANGCGSGFVYKV